MKSRILMCLAVVSMVCFAANMAVAKDDAAKAPKASKVKGVLSAKADGAAEGVVAILTAKVKKEEKKLNVITKDEKVIEKIKPLVEKGAEVTVIGTMTADGTGIEATDVAEAAAKAPKKEKAGGGEAKEGGAQE